jgi:hypothetical protein
MGAEAEAEAEDGADTSLSRQIEIRPWPSMSGRSTGRFDHVHGLSACA